MNLYLLVLLSTIAITRNRYSIASFHTVCNETEKQALLSFKGGLIDPSNRLASWVGVGNCCDWAGVVCHNLTGHVLELHLRGNVSFSNFVNNYYDAYDDAVSAYNRSCLGGKISNSLLNLRHLHYLDLSNNDFGGRQIPNFFGSMQNLRYLNLSSAGFGGIIPPQLGNLSNLLYLIIGYDELRYYSYVENLRWLSGLSMLKHLDLSYIDLSETTDWLEQINALSCLKELHLSWCELGDVPQLLFRNSSRLEILDLSDNYISSCSFLEIFHSLVSLNLGSNDIQGPIPNVLQNLTSLRDLDLSYNLHLNSSLPTWIWRFGQLEKLILGGNSDLQGDVSDAIGNLRLLTHLDLSYTSLEVKVKGPIRTLCNLQWVELSFLSLEKDLTLLLRTFLECSFNRLQHLSLQNNKLSGLIPEFIGSLISLNHLDLSYNQLNGMIPTSVGQLIQLEYLSLDHNFLEGTMSEFFFANLTRLQVLSASQNLISLEVGMDWVPPFQLTDLRLSSWQLNPTFPDWLRTQDHLSYLELDSTGIKDRVPVWFWDRSAQFHFVNLSNNGLYGEISGVTLSAYILDLGFNNFKGSLPSLTTKVYFLDLSSNSFSGMVSQFLCYKKDRLNGLKYMLLGNNQLSGAIPNCWTSWPKLEFVDLQNNNLTGNIPDSIGSLSKLWSMHLNNNSLSGVVPRSLLNCTKLDTIDVSQNLLSGPISHFLCNNSNEINQISILRLGNNQLSGDIPNCWKSWPSLVSLELQANKLTGMVPDSVGSLSCLKALHLQKNNLSGELPTSLKNCTKLIVLDIGENSFGGRLPKWIGERFNGLRLIGLRSNNFEGNIPHELCDLHGLQILDISNNKLSGQIPRCIFDFSSMADDRSAEEALLWGRYKEEEHYDFGSGPTIIFRDDSANLVDKGSEREYTTNLHFMVMIDLSNNSLSGQIPEEITNLVALISLNLSRNMLNGRIPEYMGNMSSLESLDLSFNQLFGEIPVSMAAMTKLSYLNLSYNHLTGKIPTSTQFSTFPQSSFVGNNLSTSTLISNSSKNRDNLASHSHHGVEFDEFYVSFALGFVVAFGIVVTPLLYNQTWRLVYFRTVNNILDRFRGLVVLLM